MTKKKNNLTKEENLQISWRTRPDYHGLVGSPLHTVWRSFRFTLKGKSVGCSSEWEDFDAFYVDMIDDYFDGARLMRIDKTQPFNKDNCKWVTEEELANSKRNTVLLSYNGITQTINEWAYELGVSKTGIKIRYHRGKDLSIEEILFGKKRKPKPIITDIKELTEQRQKDKVSKMLSAYRCKDKKRGYEFNITNDWLLKNIITKPCVYCGDTENVGCDRIDNGRGHTTDNVVPCCTICNTARGDNFTHFEMLKIGKSIKEVKEQRLINKQ